MIKKDSKQNFMTSILLLLVALVSISAATVAWFSITVNTKVRSMDLDVTAGISLRFDLDPHDSFEDYVKTLGFEDISERVKRDFGYLIEDSKLEPLTTSDCENFTYEDGGRASPESGEYLEFTLHFMAKEDMIVHLTSQNSAEGKADGTAIQSQDQQLAEAMRISFTVDGKNYIYDPGLGNESHLENDTKTFGLPDSTHMTFHENNALFSLKAQEQKEVVVHIWLEGTDEACTDERKNSEYKISLKFEGEAIKTETKETEKYNKEETL